MLDVAFTRDALERHDARMALQVRKARAARNWQAARDFGALMTPEPDDACESWSAWPRWCPQCGQEHPCDC